MLTAKLILSQTQVQSITQAQRRNISVIIVPDIRVQVAPFARGIKIVLSQIVIKDIQHYATMVSLDEKRTVDRLKKQLLIDDENEHSDIKQEVQKLEKWLQDIDHVTAELYEDKVIDKISATPFPLSCKRVKPNA